jgi:CTP:molybdopterin cytidylyltransferase MocA
VTAGLILAAGESRRMGSPKALLRYRQTTFLDALCRLMAERCSPVIVVLGASADEIRARSAGPATFAVNADYLSGMTTSMQCGLRAVPPDAGGVLFTLVDHPAVTPETVALLLSSPFPLLRVPRYQGRRGHPIWFSRELIPEFLALPSDGAARDVVRRHRDRTEFLDLDDPGIVADIDDPEAYRALIGAGV